MRIDFNEFLRIMSCILIILLIVQGLDYIFGFGVNNYLFILFCIAFAFTMGSVYHNILAEKDKEDRALYEKTVQEKLDIVQGLINQEYAKSGLTEEVLKSQVALNKLRNELDLPDKDKVVDEEGFVQ